MNAASVVGYRADGAVYCGVSCLPGETCPGDEGVKPIFASSEFDSYPVCEACHGTIDEVSLVHYTCKTCGHRGPNAQETGNPDECIACHKAPPALREMLKRDHEATGKVGELDAYAFPGGYPMLYVTK